MIGKRFTISCLEDGMLTGALPVGLVRRMLKVMLLVVVVLVLTLPLEMERWSRRARKWIWSWTVGMRRERTQRGRRPGMTPDTCPA